MGGFLGEKLREELKGLGEGVVLISRSLEESLVRSVEKLQAAGLYVVVVALAVHTYRGMGGTSGAPGREAAFSEDILRLKLAGAAVRVVRHPGGVAAFARGQQGAASARGAV